jgi:hypothetical protein
VESGAGCGWLEERADGWGNRTKLLILASPSAACVSHALPINMCVRIKVCAFKAYITFYQQLPLHGRVPVGGGCALIGLASDSTQNDLELKLAQTK